MRLRWPRPFRRRGRPIAAATSPQVQLEPVEDLRAWTASASPGAGLGGDDEAGNLTAGSSNGLDVGMQTAADNLGIRTVASIDGLHAEEDLLLDNKDTLWPLKRVASDNQGACAREP